METPFSLETNKKTALEGLSKEELIKRCERLLLLAQKAKHAKDIVQEENEVLNRQISELSTANEMVENLTQQKLEHVTTIESLRKQNNQLNNTIQELTKKLEACEEIRHNLDCENVAFKRQLKRLTDENEQLITDLERFEKKMDECKKLGLEQQNQLLALEKNKQEVEDLNKELQNDNNAQELQKMLTISLDEVKKLHKENSELKSEVDILKAQLCNKDDKVLDLSSEVAERKQIISELQNEINDLQNIKKSEDAKDDSLINEELATLQGHVKTLEDNIVKLKEKLKLYHGKIVKFAGNVKLLKQNKDEMLLMFKNYTDQVENWKIQLIQVSENLCSRIEAISLENEQYLNEIKILKENNNKFMKQVATHKTDDEKNIMLGQITDIKTENIKLNDEVSKLQELTEQYTIEIKTLQNEKSELDERVDRLVREHENDSRSFRNQSEKHTEDTKTRMAENEKICIEYRKVISKMEEELHMNQRSLDEVRQHNNKLQESLKHAIETEKEMADKTSKEILNLVQENAKLIEENRKFLEKSDNISDKECQTIAEESDLENSITTLRRENLELLSEMNQMNQALKERGETISKLQSHCEELLKKLQFYQSQANKNVDNISQKEEIIKQLNEEIRSLKNTQNSDYDSISLQKKDDEILELKKEICNLTEKINSNLDNSYAESETMSTSTISRSEETNRLKDLEESWEERYGKLKILAVKLKGKVRDVSSELLKEQNEFQQKCSSNLKLISTLQEQCDQLHDELDSSKKLAKDYLDKLESANLVISDNQTKILENQEVINKLQKEIEGLNKNKSNTETWKKQISAKVQTLRKELEAKQIQLKDYESQVIKLTSDLETKEKALKAESDYHQQTKSSLEHSNSERMKNSVLNLEMQDYERSVKELSQKLEKKNEETTQLKNQIDSFKLTTIAIKDTNRLLEDQAQEKKNEAELSKLEVATYKKQLSEMDEILRQKETKIQNLTELLENIKLEKEELSTELSEIITEHQKNNCHLKNDKENLRSQGFVLQQTLREVQDTLKLREDELKLLQIDYDNYKVRAQSVLRQNQSRDVGLEEKLNEELLAVRVTSDRYLSEVTEYKNSLEALEKDKEGLIQEKQLLSSRFDEVNDELENLKVLYQQLTNKHQQTLFDHSETTRSLKINSETLAQCYRQQLSEQEVRHNREIIELQSKIEKAPSPIDNNFPAIPATHREEGEGSESTEISNKNIYPVPLEKLLGSDSDQEVLYVRKQLNEEEAKVTHLRGLLADTEQDLAKYVQMNRLLKEEIRRQQRSVEREEHAKNLEYLKNIVFKFMTLHSGDERSRLVPVLNTILKFSPEETQKLVIVAKGDPGFRGWSNYLPLWSSTSKP